jgi:hypothetical protein
MSFLDLHHLDNANDRSAFGASETWDNGHSAGVCLHLFDGRISGKFLKKRIHHSKKFDYLSHFQKAYITDQVQRESQVYEKLAGMGIHDDTGVLRLFAQKMFSKPKKWNKCVPQF